MQKLFTSITYRCSAESLLPGNQPYFNFLKKGSQTLQMIAPKSRGKLGHKIYVPFKAPGRQQVKQFFEQHQIRQKNILVDVDSSHLLGVRRMLYLEHMKKNVYKDIQKPSAAISESNPQFEFQMEQIFFDDDVFFMTDPKFVHLWQKEQDQDKIDAIIQNYYDNNIGRGVERLKYDYKLPQQMLYIIETAHNFDNKIYFGGINEYDFRNVLWLYHTVDELKTMFINALHYWKQTDVFMASQNTVDMTDFNNKCRQFINQECYHIFQPYRYNRIKLLRTKLTHCYTFAHQYAFHKAGMESMNIEFGKQHSKATQNDKIEKHAILQVMLGNLWSQPYSRNKYPNLGESYNKMSQSDQATIDGIFNKHCNIYLKAVEKFRDRHFEQTLASKGSKEKIQISSGSQTIN